MDTFSVPYISITTFLDEFCVATENDNQKLLKNWLIHAKWTWKELFWKTLYVVKNKWVKVERVRGNLSRIPAPPDMARFINISVSDCGHGLRMLLMDDHIVTDLPPVPNVHTCPTCGQTDELKACINELTFTTRNIIIAGTTYKEKIWKKVLGGGDVYEYKETPYQQYDKDGNYTVAYDKTQQRIATLDTNPCGCIKDTPANRDIIINQCDCTGLLPACNALISQEAEPYRYYGMVKVEKGYIWIQGKCPPYVKLCWQSNGEGDASEIMIPEIAVDVMLLGTNYRAVRLSPRYNRIEKRDAKTDYEEAKVELLHLLNPVRVQDFLDGQMGIPLWGGVNTTTPYCDEDYFPPAYHTPAPVCLPPVPSCPPPDDCTMPPAGAPDGMCGMEVIKKAFRVGQSGSLMAIGATTLVLPYSDIIQYSVQVHLDGLYLDEAATDMIAAAVDYQPDRTTITFNQGVQDGQRIAITAWRRYCNCDEDNTCDSGNEIIDFGEGTTVVVIDWTEVRLSRFGSFPELQVWFFDAEVGKYRLDYTPDITPDHRPPDMTRLTVGIKTPGDGFIVINGGSRNY